MVDIITRESPKNKPNSFFINITALMTVLVKRASQLPLKLKAAPSTTSEHRKIEEIKLPKKLLKNIRNKAMPLIEKMKKKKEKDWGNGGVWQKAILMGDKCEPLDFSGVIYYDSCGKQVNEYPIRSPRVSHVNDFSVQGKMLH